MKKFLPYILGIICIIGGLHWLFSGYEPSETLYFSGTHEYFMISDCTLTVKGKMEIENHGKLTITEPSKFENIMSCTMSFYTITNGTRDLGGNSTTRIESDTEPINLDGYKFASNISISAAKTSNMIKFSNSTLWFELKTTDINGVENVYQIPLMIMK